MARLGRAQPAAYGNSHLSKPAVVGPGIYYRGILVKLAADGRTRLFHATRQRAPHSRLRPPPPAVGGGIAFGGPRARLADPLSPQLLNRRHTLSRLSPPTVVTPATPAAVFVAAPVRVTLVDEPTLRSRDGQRAAYTRLFPPPPVVGNGVVFRPVKVALAADVVSRPASVWRQRRPYSHLFPPTVVGAGIVFRPVKVAFAADAADRAAHNSLQRRPTSRLRPPAVVGAGIVFAPVRVELAPSKRGTPKPKLFGPAVVGAGIVFRPPLVAFVRPNSPNDRNRRRPVYRVGAPQVVFLAALAAPVRVTLAPSRRGTAKPKLFAPAVVTAAVVAATFAPVAVHLAPSRRGKAKPRLFAPAVVGAGVYYRAILQRLAPSSRGKPKPRLAPPAVVGAGIVYAPIRVELAPSKRGTPKSRLFPPAINPTFRPVAAHSAYSRRGTPKSKLFPTPPVVGNGVYFRAVKVALTYSRRGTPKSRLNPPTVVNPLVTGPAEIYGPTVKLAYSRRGTPKPRLRPPTVVGAGVFFRAIKVSLAPSKRGQPKPRLFGPAINPTFRPLVVRLAPSRRGLPKSRLFNPQPLRVFRPILVRLAPSQRGLPKSKLFAPQPPLFIARPTATRLTQPDLRPRQPHSRLSPPAVVGAGVFYGPISTRLAVQQTRVELARRAPRFRLPKVVPDHICFSYTFDPTVDYGATDTFSYDADTPVSYGAADGFTYDADTDVTYEGEC